MAFSTPFCELYCTLSDKIYVSNAGYGTGITYVCDPIPKTMKEMLETLKLPREKELSLKDFSCTKVLPGLLFVSNRHFRTPFIPEILTSIINEKNNKPLFFFILFHSNFFQIQNT